MKVKVCTLILILFSTFAQAANLPFIGKRSFNFSDIDESNVIGEIYINKKGDTRIFTANSSEISPKLKLGYHGKYRRSMHDDNTGNLFDIINSQTIAIVSNSGLPYSDACGTDRHSLCATSLKK